MKCIVNCCADTNLWTNNFFPGLHPYLLKILNKPLIEYYIDLCVLLGITEIKVVSDSSDTGLLDYLSDGTQWGVEISYSLSKQGDCLSDTISKNKGFINNNKLLLLDGYIFVSYDKKKKDFGLLGLEKNTSVYFNKKGGMYFLSDINNPDFSKMPKYSYKDISVTVFKTIEDYYKTSMDILKNSTDNYVIPGYSSEDNVFIGQNVEMTKMTKINEYSALGNNVRLTDAVVGPMAIVGSNSFIDKKTIIENAIVYDGTYIGSSLEIFNKIIYKKKIIDPLSGEILEVPDNFIISKLQKKKSTEIIEKSFFRIIGLVLAILQFPLYYLLIAFTTAEHKKLLCIISQNSGKEEILHFIEKKKNSFINGLFFKLSLNKFHLLLKAVTGKIHLTGNTPLTKDNRELIKDMSNYRPAVFTINDMMNDNNKDEFIKNINELFYSNNLSFKLNVKIIIKSVIQNLLN
jgi:NDP-sugar pyrophosphorylase family protein